MSKNKSGAPLHGATPPHPSLDHTYNIHHTQLVSNINSSDRFVCRQIWWANAGAFPAQPGLIVLRGGRDG